MDGTRDKYLYNSLTITKLSETTQIKLKTALILLMLFFIHSIIGNAAGSFILHLFSGANSILL